MIYLCFKIYIVIFWPIFLIQVTGRTGTYQTCQTSYRKLLWDIWEVSEENPASAGIFQETETSPYDLLSSRQCLCIVREVRSMHSLITNRPPGELEHYSESLSSSLNLLFLCLLSFSASLFLFPYGSHIPLSFNGLSALAFLIGVNVSFALYPLFPRKDLNRRGCPTYAFPAG